MQPINPLTQLFILAIAASVGLIPLIIVGIVVYIDKFKSRERKLRQIDFPAQVEIWQDVPYVDVNSGNHRSH